MAKQFNLRAFVVSTLRRASYRHFPREEARRKAKIGRNQYKCNKCEKIVKRSESKLDHIVPVVGKEGFSTFDNFIERLFCTVDGFQVLCVLCHNIKSAFENAERREYRKTQTKGE